MPALSATRTLASLLVLGSGLFYLVASVRGVGWLLGPPPEMVTRAAASGSVVTPTRMTAYPADGNAQLEVLLRPLAVTGTALAGLLLAWSGCRGLRSRHDQRRWRRRQLTGLTGFAVGMPAFAVGLAATGASVSVATGYADAAWLGLDPIRPSAALALLVGTIALLVPPSGPGEHHPAHAADDE
jgi:hypothetical protein